MLRRLACAAAVVAILASACTGRRGETPTSQVVSEEAQLEMTVKVRGDLHVDFDGMVLGKYSAIRSTASGSSVQVLGVRPVDALRYEKAALVPGMSVIPYRGDGTYVVERSAELRPGEAPPPPTAGTSSVNLVWYADGNLEGEPMQFNRHLVNCVVKVDKDGTTGKANCPRMTTLRGDKTISLEFKWKAPKFTPSTRVSLPPDLSTSSSMP